MHCKEAVSVPCTNVHQVSTGGCSTRRRLIVKSYQCALNMSMNCTHLACRSASQQSFDTDGILGGLMQKAGDMEDLHMAVAGFQQDCKVYVCQAVRL